jgi:hypothetical protein
MEEILGLLARSNLPAIEATEKGQLRWGCVGPILFIDFEFGFDLEVHQASRMSIFYIMNDVRSG